MATQRKRTGVSLAAGLAVSALLSVGLAPAANAEPVEMSWQLVSGTVHTDPDGDGLTLPSDGTVGIVGVWDDETGDFDGEFVVPEFVYVTEDGIEVIIDFENTQMTGSIDPDTGEVNLAGTTSIHLDILFGVYECFIDPVDLDMSSTAPGGMAFDFDTETFAMGQDDITVPAAECYEQATGTPNALVSEQVNETLGIPTGEGDNADFAVAVLEFAPGELVAPTPIPRPEPDTTPDDDLEDPTDPADDLEEIVEIVEIIEPVPAAARFTG